MRGTHSAVDIHLSLGQIVPEPPRQGQQFLVTGLERDIGDTGIEIAGADRMTIRLGVLP